MSSRQEIIRIKVGVRKPFVDVDGNTWLPDKGGFTQGVVADRDVITPVKGTRNPALYRSERYGMTAFSWPVPNGDYVIRLHFAEMYPRITGPGQRVFTFNVEGFEVKDFDIWIAAGGSQCAHIESVQAHIEDGRLDITFTKQIQSPTVNAIEIVPAALAEK